MASSELGILVLLSEGMNKFVIKLKLPPYTEKENVHFTQGLEKKKKKKCFDLKFAIMIHRQTFIGLTVLNGLQMLYITDPFTLRKHAYSNI